MSDEIRLPCRESDTPDDWFISKDGKQYGDEEFLTHEQREEIAEEIRRETGTGPGIVERIEAAVDVAEAEVKRGNLKRRRHARDDCHTSCNFRTLCLQQALDQGQEHGTWGGYYEEQLRELRRQIARRKRRTI